MERDFHCVTTSEELLRWELCGKTKVFEKITVMLQQRCVRARQEGWWDQMCEKRKHEAEDGESELEKARVSRNLFDLFEQVGQPAGKNQ